MCRWLPCAGTSLRAKLAGCENPDCSRNSHPPPGHGDSGGQLSGPGAFSTPLVVEVQKRGGERPGRHRTARVAKRQREQKTSAIQRSDRVREQKPESW